METSKKRVWKRLSINSPHLKKDVQYTSMDTAPMIIVIVAAVLGAFLLSVAAYITWRKCYQKRKRSSSYEQIIADTYHVPITVHTESTNGCPAANLSMKQIPFTVPPPVDRSSPRRMDRGVSEDAMSYGGRMSEPTSPSVKRPSVEIPGAYALGSIDPSLYKIVDEDDIYDIPPDHIGRIWFAVEYERETEKLLVTLIKAKNLLTRQYGNNSSCDPFVRIYLMPDERRYLQSKFKKKTCNPKFEESYVFQVSLRSLQDRVLKFTVFDVDRHKRHNVIGHALYPLKDHDGESNERLVFWRNLEREVTESAKDKGELLLSLSYNNHLERLTVGVYEGRSFQVDGSADKPLGRVILGSFMFARGKELDHWNEMVANQKEQITQWHALV